jgi:hypothetical protein
VIPEAAKKRLVCKGEDLLVVATGNTIVLKKLPAMSFDEVVKPIWRTVKATGLSRGELDGLIEEAKTQTRSRH